MEKVEAFTLRPSFNDDLFSVEQMFARILLTRAVRESFWATRCATAVEALPHSHMQTEQFFRTCIVRGKKRAFPVFQYDEERRMLR